MRTYYKSCFGDTVPLSDTGKGLMQGLRTAIQNACIVRDFNAYGQAVSRARLNIVKYVSYLETKLSINEGQPYSVAVNVGGYAGQALADRVTAIEAKLFDMSRAAVSPTPAQFSPFQAGTVQYAINFPPTNLGDDPVAYKLNAQGVSLVQARVNGLTHRVRDLEANRAELERQLEDAPDDADARLEASQRYRAAVQQRQKAEAATVEVQNQFRTAIEECRVLRAALKALVKSLPKGTRTRAAVAARRLTTGA